MFNFWWSAGLVNGLKPHLPPLSYQKNEMLIFQIHSTCDDQSSWSMDSNPICHTSPTKKMKCSFLDYIQLLMLARLVNGLKPHLPPLCSQKNEMLLFWITLNFWWLARLVDGLELHPPPVSSQKMKCSYFDFAKLLMIGRAVQWTRTPSTTRLHPKKWNAHFWIMFNFWWSAGLVNGLKPHLPPLSYQKNEMLIFQIHSTCDDQSSCSMNSNPICHSSPANKMKCSFLYYVQFLMLARLVNGLKPHPPPLSSQ